MQNADRPVNSNNFEDILKEYLKQGKERLDKELIGTREAIKMVASDKTREFIKIADKGLAREEREFLSQLIVSSMHQSFCYGYGIGKMEGVNGRRVML